MTNFDVFNKDELKTIIDPFINGMAEHITPIKYEALTPDILRSYFVQVEMTGMIITSSL
jgi:hypothetical protein